MSTQIPTVGFISLGCPKATVDAERILSQLRSEGYAIVPDYADAELVIVNTCGFIDAAVEESLDAISEALAENGRVIVTGCLGARGDVVKSAHPAVLAVTGPDSLDEVMQAVHEVLPPQHDPYQDLLPPGGIKLTPRHYAYIKIAEGCNQSCSFCIIPSLRGKLNSRPAGAVLDEADSLVSAGVRELLIVSQDTAAYGVDSRYALDFQGGKPVRRKIFNLVRELSKLPAWLRLHYLYPYPHIDELVELMAEGLVLPYLDVPLQHASPGILKAMRRPANTENMLKRIQGWRETCTELTLRSTFIVGFPGETEADFEQLLDFIKAAQLDRVGAFAYSPVEGAPANALPGLVSETEKEARLAQFMETQQAISSAKLQQRIGEQTTVLIDDVVDGTCYARSPAEAPEVDGFVLLAQDPEQVWQVGDFVNVQITGADAHDLYAVAD
ncbi:30S ribosomal protein S12 methylthiotransferase RimO [Candidatus Venteria ishoeyi]|uniref:30S ribosomal protein S12 methylthiotransferase RimO n=1 Tax=Candidatus Venteria ishoeyi TaxID=1899563 RepID=UPI0025A5767A|nr:30S ribosomal protein S12 methylthiotransferase RimO [Candidatus Venteria ishoeyi]MDM8545443.1 30S ribosomal protein S12 methylthiotransferase RimO [Candidatus Venteria ishoeyi]